MSDGKPKKHHYLPVFYLKRWAQQHGDEKLVEFCRPYGSEVKPRRTTPAGTGYLFGLYAIDGLPPATMQKVEEEFMRPVDTYASIALDLLERGDDGIKSSLEVGSSWSLFLMSLMMRMPSDLEAFKLSYERRWKKLIPKMTEKYSSRTGDDFSASEIAVRAILSSRIDEMAMELFTKLVDHQNIGKTLNNLHWFTIETDQTLPEFFTSDQPMVMGPGLGHQDAFIYLPIGPRRVFVAVKDPMGERVIRARAIGSIVRLINEIVVEQAHARAYATSDRYLRFMQKRLARAPHVSWFKRLDEHWVSVGK